MAQTVQILRTTTNIPPPTLLPGALSVELGTETRLWIGAAGGNRLLLSSAPADVVAGNFLPLIGGTMLGPLVLAGPPTVALHAATKAYVDLKAPLADPVFTGDPRAPTPATADNDTSIATTAFVKAQGYATTASVAAGFLPLAGGTLSGSLVLTVPLAVASGGTAATTASQALINLGAIAKTGDTITGGLVINSPAATVALLTNNPIQVGGSSATLQFQDRVTNTSIWNWYATEGSARLNLGSDLVTVSSIGNLSAAGNINTGLAYTFGNQVATVAGAIGFTNGNGPQIQFFGTSAGGLPGGITFLNAASTMRLEINTAGDIICAGTLLPNGDNNNSNGIPGTAWFQVVSYNYVTSSDTALKTDIAPAPPALQHVLALSPKTFRWKDGPDTERQHHGFLADEVKAALGADFGGYRAGEPGHQGVAYDELTCLLWRAVQELAAHVKIERSDAQSRGTRR